MVFVDRESAYPNRYLMTAEDGSTSYVVLERADEPTKVGTPLNAETFNPIVIASGTESEDHPICYCRVIDGEVEWINPPMLAGVEYRTSERHDGKPVYVKRIVFTQMPTSAGEVEAVAFPAEYQCVGVCGLARAAAETFSFPLVDLEGTFAWLVVSKTWADLYPDDYSDAVVILRATKSLSRYTAECTVKYVKG